MLDKVCEAVSTSFPQDRIAQLYGLGKNTPTLTRARLKSGKLTSGEAYYTSRFNALDTPRRASLNRYELTPFAKARKDNSPDHTRVVQQIQAP